MWNTSNNLRVIFLILCLVANLKEIACVVCSEDFCTKFLEDTECPNIPENCEYQNSTHNGLVLPYPGPCNCCEYCIKNLEKGDGCALGGIYNPLPGIICGNSLMCTMNPVTNEGNCQQLMSRCTLTQRDFDYRRTNGLLGYMELRPNCDYSGSYEPYKCIPGEICYCVDLYGNRIFGEISYTQHPELFMQCGCSRSYATVSSLVGEQLPADLHFRCLRNGDYDPLQCINGNCFCVHPRDGLASIDNQRLVNASTISEKDPLCFDKLLHTEHEYYKPCEEKYLADLQELNQMEEDEMEVFGFVPPNCQLDGNYAPVQTTTSTQYCSDSNGNQIENFAVLKTDPETLTMDCKCARVRSMALEDEKIERPKCCGNGNYRAVQCRRGLCRCVDNNGYQQGRERSLADINRLPCFARDCL